LEDDKKYSLKSFYFWKITFSLALASFFVFASLYAVQPLLPLFVEVYGVTVSTSSLSLSITVVSLIIGLLVLGFFSDRAGRTGFIHFSLIGSVIPFFLIPLSDSFFILLLLRFVQGFALAGLPAAAIAYLNEEIDRKSAGIATALYISSNAVGGMAGRVLTGYIADTYSWETAFYFLGGLGLAITLSVFFLLPKSRFFKPSNGTIKKDIEGFLYHIKNPALLIVIGMGIVLQLSFTGIWTYLPFHLQEEPFSLSIEAISYTFFAYGLGVIGSPLAGWLAGKFKLEHVRVVGIIVLSFGVFLTYIMSLPVIIIGLCVMCLGFFTAHSLTATSVAEKAKHHKGSASSLYLVAYYVGVTLGSSAVSPVWSAGGWLGVVLLAGILPLVYLMIVQFTLKRI